MMPIRARLRSCSRRTGRSRGVALVLVLSLLVLTTGLILAFFLTTRTELAASSRYKEGALAQQIADTTIAMVQSQISEATSQTGTAWASQPGMIRTWTDSGQAGNFYKLYSAPHLVMRGADFSGPNNPSTMTDVAPTDWDARIGQWVDLNEPAITAPDASGNFASADAPRVYPIVDPAAENLVDGFSIDTASGPVSGKSNPAAMPVQWMYLLADGSLTTPTSYDAATGSVSGWTLVKSGNSTSSPNFTLTPIVGRIAFWTDDDTCKLNINTASEGVYWDTPALSSRQDYAMAIGMPVPGEHQRTPGHPATTSLSPVLGATGRNGSATPLITPLTTDQRVKPGTTNGTVNWDLRGSYRHPATLTIKANQGGYTQSLKPYYDLVPRVYGDKVETSVSADISITQSDMQAIEANGSKSRPWDPSNDGQSTQGGTHYTTAVGRDVEAVAWGFRIPSDSDRLFASVPEFLFQPKATGQSADDLRPEFFQPDGSNPDKAFLSSGSAARARNLAKVAGFFLTTHSRAPETTLFNTPRIALWPIQQETNATASQEILFAQERLIKLCASVGKDSSSDPALYAFQRLNLAVNKSTKIALPSSTDNRQDYDAVARNQDLMDRYFANLTTDSIPGFGGSFASKWGAAGRAAMGVVLFDTLRTGLRRSAIVRTDGTRNSYAPRNPADSLRSLSGYTVPLKLNGAKGNANQHLVSGATLAFINSSNATEGNGTQSMQFFILFQMYYPNRAMPGKFRYRMWVEGADSLSVTVNPPGNGTSVTEGLVGSGDRCFRGFTASETENLPDCAYALYRSDGLKNEYNPGDGRDLQIRNMLPPGSGNGSVSSPAKEDADFPFVSKVISIGGNFTTNGTFSFSGGTLTVHMLEPDGPQPGSLPAAADRIQTVEINLPALTGLPLPENKQGSRLSGLALKDRAGDFLTFDPVAPTKLVKLGDYLKGVGFGNGTSSRGDLRTLAMSTNLTTSAADNFQKHSLYDTGRFASFAYSRADGKMLGYGDGSFTGTANASMSRWARVARVLGTGAVQPLFGLVQNSPYNTIANQTPVGQFLTRFNANATNSKGRLGDWTSGPGGYADGAITSPQQASTLVSWSGGWYYPQSASSGTDEQTILDFSPNREAPSPVIFGSLLTANNTGTFQGWTTLLFNPAPAAGLASRSDFGSPSALHPGFESPPDHLILDNFWMPIVEPYAVSEPMSTAGKVNLNYQMWPFPYIERSTAMRGVLANVQLAALKDSVSDRAKRGQAINDDGTPNTGNLPLGNSTGGSGWENERVRHALNLSTANGSLSDFKAAFDNGDLFRSASQICEVVLVPEGETRGSMATWWSDRRTTSDSLRESPYLSIYPRVTTKSNSYTVHYRVQSLKQSGTSRAAGVWLEGRDAAMGEYRGNASMERYIDPSDSQIPDYLSASSLSSADPIDRFYRWRIVSKNRFAP